MGYDTAFKGCLFFNKPLSKNLADAINRYCSIRHCVYRDKGEQYGPDGKWWDGDELDVDWRKAIFEYDETERKKQEDYNQLADGLPSFYCQWKVSDDRREIVWDGGEKFYGYIQWLEIIIDHFLRPNLYVLNGEMEWQGEDASDTGIFCVCENKVYVKRLNRQ